MAMLEGQVLVNLISKLLTDGLADICDDKSKVLETEKAGEIIFGSLNWSHVYKWLAVALVSTSTTVAYGEACPGIVTES